MKTKEEVIKEAWDIHWNKMDKRGQEQAIEDNGYCHKNYVKSEIDFEIEVHKYPDVDFIRPKSLQGIENNNGWIKGNPTKDGNYKLYSEKLGEHIWAVHIGCELEMSCLRECYTHYQEIEKSEKPHY